MRGPGSTSRGGTEGGSPPPTGPGGPPPPRGGSKLAGAKSELVDLVLELDRVLGIVRRAALVDEEVVVVRLLGARAGGDRGQAGVADRPGREALVDARVVRVGRIFQLVGAQLPLRLPQSVEDRDVGTESDSRGQTVVEDAAGCGTG